MLHFAVALGLYGRRSSATAILRQSTRNGRRAAPHAGGQMQYRRLAGTDLDVSVLCFGPTRTGSPEAGEDARNRTGERAFAAALDAGMNFVHSSYEYRRGSMATIGEVTRSHPKRNDIHHVVKVPVPDFEDNGTFSEAKFRQRVEEALTLFNADRIAVLQWMWRSTPNDNQIRLPMLPMIIDDVSAAFERMRSEGKVGYLMTFPYTIEAGRAALALNRFSGMIGYFNPLTLELSDILPELEKRGQGFIALRPLYEGLLTDKRPTLDSLSADDRLHAREIRELYELREIVARTFAEEIGDSMTRFALRFPLYSAATASIAVGLNTEDQVRSAIAMVDGVKPRPDVLKRATDLWKTELRQHKSSN